MYSYTLLTKIIKRISLTRKLTLPEIFFEITLNNVQCYHDQLPKAVRLKDNPDVLGKQIITNYTVQNGVQSFAELTTLIMTTLLDCHVNTAPCNGQ